MVDANTPGLLIDPSCELLIEGFEAEYKFPKLTERAANEYADAPLKNKFANVHDALQYGILGIFSPQAIIREAGRAGRPANVHSLHEARAGRGGGNGWNFSGFG